MSQFDMLERPRTTGPAGTRLLGRSAAMRVVRRAIERAAASDDHAVITGEAGVGKPAVARMIHARSRRASAPMAALHCAGLPDLLLESELFGHVRGAFTGAYRDKPGLLEIADDGTLFLDDVGTLSPRMQAVLLRFVASGEIQRLGSDCLEERANVRLIAGAPADLHSKVAAGSFCPALYARLQVTSLEVPPLRERAEDIPVLVDDLLQAYADTHRVPKCDMSPEALELLGAYRWPRNVDQLEHVVERLALMARAPIIGMCDLPSEVLHQN